MFMKNADNPFSINGFNGKIGNAILTLVGLIFVVWLIISKQSFTGLGFAYDQQIKLGLWIIAFGLFGMAFSKERIDDERVQEVRNVIMRNCFRFLLVILMLISLRIVTQPEFEFKYTLELTILCLIGYHIFFNAALYFNPSWITTEYRITSEMRIQPKFYLLFAIVQLILLAVLYWFYQ